MMFDGRGPCGKGPWGWGCGSTEWREQRRAARDQRKAAKDEWKAGLKQAKRAYKHWKRAGAYWTDQPEQPHPTGPQTSPGSVPPQWGHGRSFRILEGLHRDVVYGKVAGVCAGLAHYYGLNRTLVRLVAVVALFINFPLTLIAYAAAAYFMPRGTLDRGAYGQPPAAASPPDTPPTGPAGGLPPELSFAALREKFRELEGRTGEMEREVSAPEFGLRRELNRMGG